MRRFPFTKLSGAGNDFILIDLTLRAIPVTASALARRLCARRTSIGADGLLLVRRGAANRHARADYHNADGSRAFCGNGIRCAAAWMRRAGWCGRSFSIKTPAGLVDARVDAGTRARVRLPGALALLDRRRLGACGRSHAVEIIDTGAPHAVVRVPPARLANYPVVAIGRALRRHPALGPEGANIDFVSADRRGIRIRTYERGVEDETLACGTGAAAAALVLAARTKRRSPIRIKVKSSDVLSVSFRSIGNGRFEDAWLEGPVKFIYEGELRL